MYSFSFIFYLGHTNLFILGVVSFIKSHVDVSLLLVISVNHSGVKLKHLATTDLWEKRNGVIILVRGGSDHKEQPAGADLGILRAGVLGRNSSKGGGVRVQVHGNFHILTRKKNNL